MTATAERARLRVTNVFDDQTELDPVIFDGEDPAMYRELRARMYASYAPADEGERILLDSAIIDHWDAARNRRLLLKFIAAAEPDGLRSLLAGLPDPPPDIEAIVAAFAAGETAAAAVVLASAGLDLESVRAQAMALRLDGIGRFDALIRGPERRRDVALRDLDRVRARRARLAAADRRE